MIQLDINNLAESLKKAREEFNNFGNKVNVIVSPFINDTLPRKEVLEICHVGKFLVVLDKEINLLEKAKPPKPDFIIECAGEKIGLEVERVFNLEEVQNIKSKQGLFEKAAHEFENSNPNVNVMVNFWTIEGFEFEGNDKKSLIAEINSFVFETVNGNKPVYPSFIEKADFMPHSQVNFNFNEGGYSSEDISDLTLNEAIQKKEAKFNQYKLNTGLDRQWLLLVSGIGLDSFNIENVELPKEIESQFEHIYLLEDFEARVTEIK